MHVLPHGLDFAALQIGRVGVWQTLPAAIQVSPQRTPPGHCGTDDVSGALAPAADVANASAAAAARMMLRMASLPGVSAQPVARAFKEETSPQNLG
jgi:hypothetical protein